MNDSNEFFYCYSPKLFKFLKFEKGLSFICVGLHENTFEKFWQFKRSDSLIQALTEYRNRDRQGNLE